MMGKDVVLPILTYCLFDVLVAVAKVTFKTPYFIPITPPQPLTDSCSIVSSFKSVDAEILNCGNSTNRWRSICLWNCSLFCIDSVLTFEWVNEI